MSGRPEQLFPLFAELETLQGVGPKTAEHFAQIQMTAPRDLLFSLPYSVVDRRRRDTIKGLELPATATVEVNIGRHRPARNKGAPTALMLQTARRSFSWSSSTGAVGI